MVAEANNENSDGSITPRVITQIAGLDRQVLKKILPQTDVTKNRETENTQSVLHIEWERKDALEAIQEAVANLSPLPSDIANKIATLSTAQNVSIIRGLKSEIQQDIRKEIAQRQQEVEQLNTELVQSVERVELIKALHQYDADTKPAREQMRKDGYGDADNEAKLKALQAELDREQEGSSRWLQIRDKMLELDEQYFKKVIEQAHENGDVTTEKNAGECVNKAWEMRKKIACIWNHDKEIDKGSDETLHKSPGLNNIGEEETPPTTNNSGHDSTKIIVAHANHDDIETPSGGKDRISSRIKVKT